MAELRFVKVREDLGKGEYLAEDVFSEERIKIKLSGKQRMNFMLPLGAVVYAVTGNQELENARFIYTWRDPFRMDNTETFLEKQRKELDAKFIDQYGMDEFEIIYVFGESKKFKF